MILDTKTISLFVKYHSKDKKADNMRFFKSILLLLTFYFLLITPLAAQKPIRFESPEFEFNTAMELFQKEKYGSAQQYFKYVYENTPNKQQDIKSNSYFYIGVCAAQLYNEDAIFYLSDFIRIYPVHSLVPEAYYYLGKFYFHKKQYKKVLETFDKIDERHVRPEEMGEFYFKKGYSYFATNKYDDAKTFMYRAKRASGPYQERATYYLAHIAYEEQQYEAALEGFLELQDSYEYKALIPYYVVQILFLQQKYADLVEIAPPLFENSNEKSKTDIARAIALSYYNLGQYKNAEPYFNFYLDRNRGSLDSSDCFAAGYTYYNVENYKKAIEYLSQTTKTPSIMSQTSLYVLGDCYMKNSQLSLASQMFHEAYKMKIDPEITEDALYNYAKLQYETSNQPFNTAIGALEEYITQYPYSTRSDEASGYLSRIYLSTKNYQGAITSLEKIPNKTPDLLRGYQRCTYYRALELVNNNDNSKALVMIEKSIKYPLDPVTHASALYWKGEIEYRLGKYGAAAQSLRLYQRHDLAKKDQNYTISFYSLGYAHIKQDQFSDAITAFNRFLDLYDGENQFLVNDAQIRVGDSYYMQKKFSQAITAYQKNERIGIANKDYVLFQQAKAYGYQRSFDKKIEILERLIRIYPSSSYAVDAQFELASTYHLQKQYSSAIASYQSFISKYPRSVYTKQAYNKMALAYLNIQDTENAIKNFKYVIDNYKGSQESIDAISNLESIYTDQGNTAEFFDYIRTKNVNYSESKQDSVAFKAAHSKFTRGDCDGAIKGYEDYLRQFPNGLFAATALFNKGECEYGNKNYDKALISYEALVTKYNTNNNEVAVKKLSIILFNKNEYARALEYFTKLIELSSSQNNTIYAHNGVMRCAFELGRYRQSLESAEAIINSDQNDQDLKNDALIYAGRSAYLLNENITAKRYFSTLATSCNNEICAEAAYKHAEITFNEKDYEEAERLIKRIISGSYTSAYWLGKTFILYGDWYTEKENYFQARHTYQSIVDNFEGELKEIALQKISEVTALENAQ